MIENQTKKSGGLLWLLVIVLIIGSFFGGFFVNDVLESNKEKDTKEEEKKEETKEEVKETILAKDRIIVNTAGAGYIYYVDNDNLYYMALNMLNDGSYRFVQVSFYECINGGTSSYCEGNKPYYHAVPVKVDGIGEVSRVKIISGPGTGESFQAIAIGKNGNIYELKGNTASEIYKGGDATDIVSQKESGGASLAGEGQTPEIDNTIGLTIKLKDGSTKEI